MSATAVLSSDASRGILKPVPDDDLNSSRNARSDSKNDRKTAGPEQQVSSGRLSAMEELLKAAIIVKPFPSTIASKPHILHPLMLLPREHLSLASLDLSNPSGPLPLSAAYESNIRILDLEGRLGCSVLLARAETTATVYALEQQEKGRYSLCKLVSTFEVRDVMQLATTIYRPRLQYRRPPAAIGLAEAPTTTPQLHKENNKKRLAIEQIQSMVRKRLRSPSVALPLSQELPHPEHAKAAEVDSAVMSKNDKRESDADNCATTEGSTHAVVPAVVPVVTSEPAAQPGAEDIFRNIRTQYFEALYHSKGSLAYFAKGPLSRARAAFHMDYDSNLDMSSLVEFLKSLTMTTVLIETKYRQGIPDCVAKLNSLAHVSDADLKSKKKAKKAKLGRDGLYNIEEEHIQRWWAAQKAENANSEDAISNDALRYLLSLLKMRETQLQIIVILEIMALESLVPSLDAEEQSQLPGLEPMPVAGDAPAKRKKRNKHNFPMLLDVHADRLCIWQSTMMDDVKGIVELGARGLAEVPQTRDKNQSDPLRDFCVDIIVPFFSSRLPEACDSINRKLGGPLIKSPPKPDRRTASKAAHPKPGEPKGPVKKEQRTLDRALSDERARRSVSRAPSLIAHMRSASSTFIPGLKREGSEPLMASIPKGGSGQAKPKGTLAKSESQSSLASTEDVKARKRALVEAELHDAISALKKPNRALAGKSIVEFAEKRSSAGISQLRKARKPVRLAPSGVQVQATPANQRFKDALAGEKQSGSKLSVLRGSEDSVPSSSSMIPSTAARRGPQKVFSTSPAFVSTPPTAKVQATPAKLAQDDVPALKLSRPAAVTSTPSGRKVQSTLARLPSGPLLAVPGRSSGRDIAMIPPSSPGFGRLLEDTPMKPRPTAAGRTLRTVESAIPAAPAIASIYEQLGWDDDGDLDDLA